MVGIEPNRNLNVRQHEGITMEDTLLSDVDVSIYWYYVFYCVSNAALVITSIIVITVPMLTSAEIISHRWGIASALFGALLAYLGLAGVSTSFIKARNDLQIAKYRYYTDHNRDNLIASYEKAKALASYIPSTPSADKGSHSDETPKK
jgi:hypothetical protein